MGQVVRADDDEDQVRAPLQDGVDLVTQVAAASAGDGEYPVFDVDASRLQRVGQARAEPVAGAGRALPPGNRVTQQSQSASCGFQRSARNVAGGVPVRVEFADGAVEVADDVLDLPLAGLVTADANGFGLRVVLAGEVVEGSSTSRRRGTSRHHQQA